MPDSGGVYVVPAFTGLGAPYWDDAARGTIVGLTRGSTRAHLVRAALEGIAHQVADVVAAMEADAGAPIQAMRVDGGAKFPPLPNPARASPPPVYEANVDEGLVSFDRLGVLYTIDWEGFRIDAQYDLPPSGRVRLAAIFTQAYSRNMSALYPQGGAEIDLVTHVADRVRYIEGNIFWDVTPEVRLGAAGIHTTVRYLDGEEPQNIRVKGTANYFF